MDRSHSSDRPTPSRAQGKTYADDSSPASSCSSFDNYCYSYSTGSRSTTETSCRSWEPLKRVLRQAQESAEEKPLQQRLTVQDLPPTVTQIPSGAAPNASVITYNSVFSSTESHDRLDEEGLPAPTEDAIPPCLPSYRASIVDPMVRPSDPDSFERLFPSLDRLSIRHDDLTHDGNMNLRVDTIVPRSNGDRPVTVQLFHLRLRDLAHREFALRRYCRDSGREVCHSKRAYAEPPPASRPGFQRSMSSAFNVVRHPFVRRGSNASTQSKRPSTAHSNNSSSWDCASLRSIRRDSWVSDKHPTLAPASALLPTNTIKLEFSNYGRVEVARNGGDKTRSYGFEWWGEQYAWKRMLDKSLGTASFHLYRHGTSKPMAHIIPESRSPNQLMDDEYAGGWIPPCHMWISDESVLEAKTDVADVIIATGLIALVDNSIKARWDATKKPPRRTGSGDHLSSSGMSDAQHSSPPHSLRGFFQRRHSEHISRSPLRRSRPMACD